MLAACASEASRAAQANLLEQAAQEATAIVQQAQATALLVQAQAQATAVMSQAKANDYPTPIPEATWRAYLPTPEPTQVNLSDAQVEPTPAQPDEQTEQSVEVVSVGFAGERGLIIIRFLAPAEVTEHWWQGSVSIEEESSGDIYNEIPVLPKVGPMIARPKLDGQPGYVMLVNTPPGLKSGALVTVSLGEYRFEHVPVQ